MTPAKPKRKKGRFRWLRAFFILILLMGLGMSAAVATYIWRVVAALPSLSRIEPKPSLTSTVYAIDGSVLAELHAQEHRMPVKLSQMPESLRYAFIAMEDHRFYSHFGVDLRAIARALYVNLTGRSFQGGSTITQQLAKNAFLYMEQTYERKLLEAIYAIQLERLYTKDEILEMYLNQVNFGRGAYGVQAAAYAYFRKDVSELTLPESALLAALPWSPPVSVIPDELFRRQKSVLDEMHRHGYITAEELEAARAVELVIQPRPRDNVKMAPFFLDHVLDYVLKKYGPEMVYTGGLKIYTTLDPNMQAAMERSISEVLDPVFPLIPGQPTLQAAAVIVDPKTGHVKAMVGGRTHETRLGLNRVFSPRQPGSAIKPLVVYVPAIDLGYSPGDVVDDAPIAYPQLTGPPWEPQNYDLSFQGLVTLRTALDRSINIVAIKLLERITPRAGINYARQLGITTLVMETRGGRTDQGLALALGALTDGITPMEMTLAYGVLANRGVQVDPVAILRVVDKDGNVFSEAVPRPRIVLSEQTVFMVTHMLQSVITSGTGRSAAIGRPVAGKTGTTDDYRDAWFVGYTPDLVGTVWMGYDKELTMESHRVTGGSYPARIWASMMKAAHEGLPVQDFPQLRKDQLVEVEICIKSGKLPGPYCARSDRRIELYLKGREPTEICDVHVRAKVCQQHPQYLASEYCPAVVERTFIKRPEPYVVGTNKKKPLDAHLELPTEVCPEHVPAWLRPPPPNPGGDG
ncbi:MAG: transglycosylase domain-containing protein [Bacillota bacterium]